MSLSLDISTDFRTVTDWLKPASVDGLDVQTSLRRAISVKEAQASEGKYTSSDVAFHLDRAEVPQQPQLGTQIIDEDGIWTILDVHWETLANRWRCVCRKLDIDPCSIVSIQSATFAKSDSGALEPTFTTTAENVVAKIQLLGTDVDTDRSNRTTKQDAVVYFAQARDLNPADRIIALDGTVLKVLSWEGQDDITKLFSAKCEVSKWPQA